MTAFSSSRGSPSVGNGLQGAHHIQHFHPLLFPELVDKTLKHLFSHAKLNF